MLKIVQSSLRSVYRIELLKTVNLKPIIKCRYATRWVSRRPVAIVNEQEVFDTDEIETTVTKVHRKPKTHRRKRSKETKNQEKTENEVEEAATTESKYTALKADDKLISSLMIDVKTRYRRNKNKQMLLEGLRLIEDALQAGVNPQVIFFSRLSDVLQLSLPKEVKLYKIPYRTIQLWSNLTTSPGILGIFDIPDISAKQPADDAIPLTIICDNIREPGNLGTIVRAAAAVGCEKLLLMKGCADLWDPKVLRGAVGAHFRLPIFTSLSWEEIPTLISEESRIFLADNNVAYKNEWKDSAADPKLDISTSIEVDDNDMKKDDLDMNIRFEYETNEDDMIDKLINQTKGDRSTAKTKSFVKRLISQLPVVPYYTLDFTQKEAVLVIGGETEGVSLQSCKLLQARNCVRVNVPLTNGVDSLNVGVAVGIVTYEIRRQFIIRKLDDE